MLDVLCVGVVGLFYFSTLVTITITRKEVVINFLMFKHNIFLLLVFVFFFFCNVLYYTVSFCFLYSFPATSATVWPKLRLSVSILVNTTSEQSIRDPAAVGPSSTRRHRTRTTDRPGRSGVVLRPGRCA